LSTSKPAFDRPDDGVLPSVRVERRSHDAAVATLSQRALPELDSASRPRAAA
jgi:hypothetical protein